MADWASQIRFVTLVVNKAFPHFIIYFLVTFQFYDLLHRSVIQLPAKLFLVAQTLVFYPKLSFSSYISQPACILYRLQLVQSMLKGLSTSFVIQFSRDVFSLGYVSYRNVVVLKIVCLVVTTAFN